MKKSLLFTFLLSFVIIYAMNAVGTSSYSYHVPAASPPGNNYNGTTPSDNPNPPMDESTTDNSKLAGLSVSQFISGKTNYIAVDSSGRMGIGKTPSSDVRIDVDGYIKSSSLSGSFTSYLCTGDTASSGGAYIIQRC